MPTEIFSPLYYDDFQCVAGACADSCCKAGWLIPIDSETYDFYRSSATEIDKNSYIDPEGDRVFRLLNDGSCVYFTSDGLCRLFIETGRQCEICTKFPRFFEEYDGFTEAGLSVACPAAAAIILGFDGFPYVKCGIRSTSDSFLAFLIKARAKAMATVYGAVSPDDAAYMLLGYAYDLQELIDYNILDRIGEASTEPLEPFSVEEIEAAREIIHKKTEILSPRWRAIIDPQTPLASRFAGTPNERKNYLLYLINRYFLKSVNTEDILAQCSFIVLMYELARRLDGDYLSNVTMIAREIEHNTDNISQLLSLFTTPPAR